MGLLQIIDRSNLGGVLRFHDVDVDTAVAGYVMHAGQLFQLDPERSKLLPADLSNLDGVTEASKESPYGSDVGTLPEKFANHRDVLEVSNEQALFDGRLRRPRTTETDRSIT